MRLSPAEISYFRDSLSHKPPIRPDARSTQQFRPLQAITSFLPTTNGSARVRTSDGAECIIGVKAKVMKTTQIDNFVNVDIDVSGYRDDHPLPSVLSTTFQGMLNDNQQIIKRLKLTQSYSFKLFIDGLVLSLSSNPLALVSLAIYLALKSTKLPLLTSNSDDKENQEIPQFSDDWDQSIPLCTFTPPISLLLVVIGDNVFVDPSHQEEQVAQQGLIVTYADGIAGPIRTIDLGGEPTQGLQPSVLRSALKIANELGPELIESLDMVVSQQTEEVATELFA